MGDSSSRYIQVALDYSRKLAVLADQGEIEARDDSCAVLYGVIRDCAFTIRSRAERERAQHEAQGRWREGE